MKKLTKRQKQAIATKLKITQIASDLFKRKGFESVKIQDICNSTGISTGAFYHHFKSKNEIINTSYEHFDLLVMEKLDSKRFSSNIDKILFLLSQGAELLQELGWAFVGDIYKNLISLDNKYSFYPERNITIEIKSAIELAIKNGEIEDIISSEALTKTILRTSRGVIFDWALEQGKYDLKTTIVNDIKLILNNYISK